LGCVNYANISTVLCLYLFPFLQSGYNTRIKAIHILNAPPYADIVINIIKVALKHKLAKRVRTNLVFSSIFHTHFAILSSIYDFRPAFKVFLTLHGQYLIVLCLFHLVCILYCVCFVLFSNVV
jgi:hypothetical protein